MAFRSYVDPIVAIVDRYFEKKRGLSKNTPQTSGEALESGEQNLKHHLPESPCKLLRDDKNRVYKCIYGEYEKLTENDDSNLVVWQEEILRSDTGQTIGVETTYPDGRTSREMIVRENSVVTGVE